MRRSKFPHPCVELFSDGQMIDVNMLNRRGAFSGPGMWFPFRRLKTYPDRIEINFRDRTRPPQIILVERTRMHFGNTRPWLVCYKCSRRCAILYGSTIDVACQKCAGLQWACQRQRRKTRLQAKAEKIRNRLWRDGEKIIRPRNMREKTYRKHLHMLQLLQHAISTGSGRSLVRSYYRFRERDEDGKYCN
jgi:hypothetical protein